jgi:hypothetical protein
LVDALDLGSSDANRGGSNPSARTNLTDPAPIAVRAAVETMSCPRCK